MSKDVFSLAQEDTFISDKNKSKGKEYAGPCPNSNCRCRTNGFMVRRFDDKKTGRSIWKFMCRGCYDAAEQLPDKGRKRGWGDEIDYLRHYKRMSFHAAKKYLANDTEPTHSTRTERTEPHRAGVPGAFPAEYWQKKYNPFVSAAEMRLWEEEEGREALEYLRSRGLEDKTIRAAHLGYAVRNGRPCIVIPWYDSREQGYWRVSLRDITPGIPKEERYKNTLPGFSKDGMYLGDSMQRKLPTFLVEGEIDALSIAQEAGDLVNVVATGSTGNGRVAKWELRLARMPSVLVAFDRETDKGDIAANHWLRVLENARRYRPLAHDANEMLTSGYDIRSWVGAALEPATVATSGTPASHQDTLHAQDDCFCSVCDIALNEVDTAAYSEDGLPYCNQDENFVAYCSRGTPEHRYERFISHVNCIVTDVTEQETSEEWKATIWTVTPIEPGYTLQHHVSKLKEQRAAIAGDPTDSEIEIMHQLRGYGLYLGESCQCGCRLQWNSAGSIVCARCEPGGLWSEVALNMLQGKQQRATKRGNSIPTWLIPGEWEWKKQVERNGLADMMHRRKIALQQQHIA